VRAALGALAGGAVVGALLLALGLRLCAAAVAPLVAIRWLAACMGVAAVLLIAVQCPASVVVAVLPVIGAATLASCRLASAGRRADLAACARQAAAAARGAQLINQEMTSPCAAATVALHGAGARFGWEAATLLHARAAAERRLHHASAVAGLAADALAVCALAGALFVPRSAVAFSVGSAVGGIALAAPGPAVLGWGVLQARWLGVALQMGAAWRQDVGPEEAIKR
jgi:hypothetical protein